MISDLVVIGMPSSVGGADVELYDQIKCWSKMGIKVHIIPTVKATNCVDLSNLNVTVYGIQDYSICEGQHVISYCNPYFLRDIEKISKLSRSTMWASCMCFNFKNEIEAAYKGLITVYLYQSYHQYQKCAGHLLKASKHCDTNKFTVSQIVPYFDRSPFHFKPSTIKPFKWGRISRADPAKFGKNQIEIIEKCNLYPVLIVGWSKKVENKFNSDWLHNAVKQGLVKLVPQGGMSNIDFFDNINIMSMTTDTFENLPRVGLEALASGCSLVVDDSVGWTNLLHSGGARINECMFNSTVDEFTKSLSVVWDGYWSGDWLKNGQTTPDAVLDRYNFENSSRNWEGVFRLLP